MISGGYRLQVGIYRRDGGRCFDLCLGGALRALFGKQLGTYRTGEEYEIYEVDGERAQQYQTDTGPLDILAISKDQRTLLVVELKEGEASDAVVGQILRYMSYVQEELAEENQMVKGMVIAHEDDPKNESVL